MQAGGELKCPTGTVYIPAGRFEGQSIGEMCVDQGEFTVEMGQELKAQHPELDIPTGHIFKRPKQPLGAVSGYQAAQICEARGMRLLTPVEWAYAASGPNRFEYSTRTGKLDDVGVYWCPLFDAPGGYFLNCPKASRDVGTAVGHYIQWGGEELFDMSGNVWEWTYDFITTDYFLSGGAYHNGSAEVLRAAYRRSYTPPNAGGTNIGFRCAATPLDSGLVAHVSPLQNFLTAISGGSRPPSKTSPL